MGRVTRRVVGTWRYIAVVGFLASLSVGFTLLFAVGFFEEEVPEVRELAARLSKTDPRWSWGGWLRGVVLGYETLKPTATDVLIAPQSKSGTTWLLHIAHQLRMRASEPTFSDQLDVAPWIPPGPAELVEPHSGGLTLNSPQDGQILDSGGNTIQLHPPRIYKTHRNFKSLQFQPVQPKLVYCFRDLKDVYISRYKFVTSEMGMDGSVKSDDFLSLTDWEENFMNPAVIREELENLRDWWEHRNQTNVMVLFYEDLVEEYRSGISSSVVRMAKFMGLNDVDAHVIQRVFKQTSHREMSSPEHFFRFDNHLVGNAKDRILGLPVNRSRVGKVRKDGGSFGSGASLLSTHTSGVIDRIWRQVIAKRLGFRNLDEMRQRNRLERKSIVSLT